MPKKIMAKDGEDDQGRWITLKNGRRVYLDKDGNIVKGPDQIKGQHISNSSSEGKKESVKQALAKLAQGSREETIPNLRNDLEKYGGTNDVTLVMGNKKKGLIHIAKRHGSEVIPGVLDAVVDGEIHRFSRGNKTVVLRKSGHEAILSLEEHGKKKTWLLTGFALWPDAKDAKDEKELSDESGKFCPRHAPTQQRPMSSRPVLGADSSFSNIITQLFLKANPMQEKIMKGLALDASARRKDENGFLHVEACPLTKEQVAPYRGREIPGYQELGLKADKIYKLYRPASELEKSCPLWAGLPVLNKHEEDSAENPKKNLRVGSLGTSPSFDGAFLYNDLVIQDADAIKAIENGSQREISGGYRYTPVKESGSFNGEKYEIVMRDIRPNHIALVAKGRAGPEILVMDEDLINKSFKKGIFMNITDIAEKVARALRLKHPKGLALDSDEDVAEAVQEALSKVVEEEKAKDESKENQEDAEAKAKDEKTEKNETKAAKDNIGLVDKLKSLLAPLLDGKDEVDGKTVENFLSEIASALAKDEEKTKADDDESKKEAKDEDKKQAEDSMPFCRSEIVAEISAGISQAFKSKENAADIVKPLVGHVSGTAFDSADDIYAYALKAQGLNPDNFEKSALKGIVQGLIVSRTSQLDQANLAKDSKDTGPLADQKLSRFKSA